MRFAHLCVARETNLASKLSKLSSSIGIVLPSGHKPVGPENDRPNRTPVWSTSQRYITLVTVNTFFYVICTVSIS